MKNNSIFVALIILNGGLFCLFVAGIFYAFALHIHGSDTPVWSVNVPTAVEVISSGKGRDRLFISGQQIIFLNDMLITEKCLNGCGASNSYRMTHQTGIFINLPTKVIETIIDLREDGGDLGDSICENLNEIIHFLIEDSSDNINGNVHSQRLQSLKHTHDLIRTLSK